MRDAPEVTASENGRWTKTTVTLVRLALLVFLLWALVSAKFTTNNPVAEDAPSPSQNNQTVVEPCSGPPQHLG